MIPLLLEREDHERFPEVSCYKAGGNNQPWQDDWELQVLLQNRDGQVPHQLPDHGGGRARPRDCELPRDRGSLPRAQGGDGGGCECDGRLV